MNESDPPRKSSADELSARDIELSRRIAAALNRSAGELDADIRAQLAVRRHEALSRSRSRRVVMGMALAASLVAIVATPWVLHRSASSTVPATVSSDMDYLSVDPQMLADMDMLQVLGESPSGASQ